MSSSAETTLGRFVDHLTQGFTRELAELFARLPKPNPEFQGRVDDLAEKANEGVLTPDEAKEYEMYIELMDFVALLRLRARSRTRSA
ncbi:MAG: hypothetical protein CMJ48_07125 [Planctomycetaceae bacterium]|nr:hypothetical protein [Planctomycetaceae bacterium]